MERELKESTEFLYNLETRLSTTEKRLVQRSNLTIFIRSRREVLVSLQELLGSLSLRSLISMIQPIVKTVSLEMTRLELTSLTSISLLLRRLSMKL